MSRLRHRIIVGDAHEQLRRLPSESIDMVLTSPPYFLLRDYQIQGQLGLEPHVDEWAESLHGVMRELHRVLLPTGSLWLNLADTYATHPRQGAPRKSLLLGPERLALLLLTDGWLLRNKIIWAKANPMPSSVRDRLTSTWEALYVFTKQPRYLFDLDAIRVPHTTSHRGRLRPDFQRPPREAWRGPNGDDATGLDLLKARGIIGHPLGKNPGDVWTLASSNYRGAHHATFPLTLARRVVQVGSPEARCTRCRAPWRRHLIRSIGGTAVRGTLGPTCECRAASEPAIVLDPFIGAGTTAVAAEQLGRDWLGVELNPDFARLAQRRIQDTRAGPTKHTA
ncbi:MAG: DNA-methyltransferase [Jatrophihabitantaceae bacterium]